MKRSFFRGHFDEKSTVKKCLWLVIATLALVVFFYAGTIVTSIIYPLDEAALRF